MNTEKNLNSIKHRLLDFRLSYRDVYVSDLLISMGPHIICPTTEVKWQYIDNLFCGFPLPLLLLEYESYTLYKGKELFNALMAFHSGQLTMPSEDPSLVWEFVAGQRFSEMNRSHQRRFGETQVKVCIIEAKPDKEIKEILINRFPNG